MDMSLDEIIKKKKIAPGGQISKRRFVKKSNFVNKPYTRPVHDARTKIIQKNRSKIRDARDKLIEITMASGDARLRLRNKKNYNEFDLRTRKYHQIKPKIQRGKAIGDLNIAPRGYVDYDNMNMLEEEYNSASFNLRRTVHNDINIPSSFGAYNQQKDRNIPGSSIWNEMPLQNSQEKMHLRRQVRNVSPDIVSVKDILGPSPSYQHGRRLGPSPSYPHGPDSHLSYEMRTRLEHAPDPHVSMGIFANSNSLKLNYPYSYRIVVSNLHQSVTQSDIKELFEDIGELTESRLVRPGIAEVVFRKMQDAEKAVDTYHNRQLDGQPMKCLLVNPRSSNKPTAPALNKNSSKSSNKTPLEIDIDALHKVLFQRQ